MSYSANKISKQVSSGRAHVFVRYASNSGGETLEKTHSTEHVYSGWPDDVINTEIARLDALDVSGVDLGPPAAPKPPDPPTPDQIEDQDFFDSSNEVVRIDKELAASAAHSVPTKMTQQDLVDAYGVWKVSLSANPDKFLPMVPKDFPVV